MVWTIEKPSKPGIYWHRGEPGSQLDEYESFKIFWDPQINELSVKTYDNASLSLDTCAGEWYGPLSPPVECAESKDSHSVRSNVRILVRLRHGGSFYLEKILPEEIAVSLSERLKCVREKGRPIPAAIRMKINDVMRGLVNFAHDDLSHG